MAVEARALDQGQEFRMHPISDLRTRLSQIEKEAHQGSQVVMNRNGKPVLLVQDYDTAMRERETERHRQKLREAEIWDRASGGRRVSLKDALAALDADLEEFKASGLGGAHA